MLTRFCQKNSSDIGFLIGKITRNINVNRDTPLLNNHFTETLEPHSPCHFFYYKKAAQNFARLHSV